MFPYLKSNFRLLLSATLLMLLVSQLALLGHVVLDNHEDHAETCEVCLKAQQQDPRLFDTPGLFQPLLLTFVIGVLLCFSLPTQQSHRPYESRAPPQ